MKNYEYEDWLDENYLSADYTDEEMEMLKEYYKNDNFYNKDELPF